MFRSRSTQRAFAARLAAPPALTVDYTAGDAVAVVRLNRPERMNALSFDMGARLQQLHGALHPATRAVVVSGAGRAFSTGRDLKDSKTHTREEAVRYMQLARDTVKRMHDFRLPTVAAISGHAFGWGFELALACDMRVAWCDATLCLPETGLGIFPGALGAVLLPRLAGPGVANDLILTARRVSGAEAHSLGVVNRVAQSPDATLSEAVSLAAAIARNGPRGIMEARAVMRDGLDMSFDDHCALSDERRRPLTDTRDFQEALAAFEQKRAPVFTGE